MQDRKLWTRWLVLLCMGMVTLSPVFTVVKADDDEEIEEEEEVQQWITVKGKGSSKKGAIAAAWREALLKHIKANFDSGDYNTHRDKIEAFVDENWRNFVKGDPDKPKVTKAWNEDTRFITIKVQFDGDALLKEVGHNTAKAGEKLDGYALTILHEKDPLKCVKDELLDCDAAFDTIQDVFGKYGARFYNIQAIKEKMAAENRALGRSAHADPGQYVMQYFNEVNIVVYVMVSSVAQKEPEGDYTWQVTISTRGVWRQTAEELWKFQVRSGEMFSDKKAPGGIRTNDILSNREARARSIKSLAEFVGEEIAFRVTNRKRVMQEDMYVLKFVGFTSKQREKIEQALEDMAAGSRPYLKVQGNVKSAGVDFFEITVKWMRSSQAQTKVAQIIKETCADNQAKVEANKFSPGVIYFEPSK